MSYADALAYLGSLGRFGMRPGLDTIERLLARLGDPHRAYPVVHVGGTNGKGSVSHAIASVLRAAGLQVGLYTSPHLLRFTERIQVGGQEIPRPDLERLLDRVRRAAEGLSATFFEVATALGFLHFAEAGVAVAVVEVGLGGRLDATNVVRPMCSVITNVSLEHREHLGDTVGEIAREKAGIIKGGRPVVVGILPGDAERVVDEIARERGAEVHRWGREFAALRDERVLGGERFWYRGRAGDARLFCPLAGRHQVTNAAIAAYTSELLGEMGLPVGPAHVAQGLSTVHVTGRFTEVDGTPPIVLDAAHNPAAARALATALFDRRGAARWAIVLGVLADKDHLEIVRALAPRTAAVLAVRPRSYRARDPADLLHSARALGLPAEIGGELDPALTRARAMAGETGGVLVTGSFYTVAEAMRVLGIGGEPDPVPLGDPVRPPP